MELEFLLTYFSLNYCLLVTFIGFGEKEKSLLIY